MTSLKLKCSRLGQQSTGKLLDDVFTQVWDGVGHGVPQRHIEGVDGVVPTQ